MSCVRDVMTSEIRTVGSSDSVQRAAEEMLACDTGSIPVVDNGSLVGMITDRDIAVRGVAKGMGADCCVSDLMSKDIISAESDMSLEQVSELMSSKQVRRVPVMENNQLVGMVSLGDLSRKDCDSQASQALEGVSRESELHSQG